MGQRAGIRLVRASPITGNVLVLFDPSRLSARSVVASVAADAIGIESAAALAVPAERRLPAGSRVEPRVAWHALSPAQTLARLGSDPEQGLADGEVARRLADAGPNTLPLARPKTTWEIVRSHLTSTPVLLLAGAAALSLVSGALVDAAVILAVVGLNATIGYVTERRVERILTSLQRAGVPFGLVRRNGGEEFVPAPALVPGDIVILRAGHEVLSDLRILVAEGLAVDESSLTGESVPVIKSAGAPCPAGAPLGDRLTMAYAGTTVVEGGGRGIVVATGAETELGRIRALVAETAMPPTPLERQLDGVGQRLVALSLGFCGLALGLGLLRGAPALEMVRIAVSLAVAAVPEGLPTVATTTLALGTHRMLKQRTLVRRLAAVEGLGAITVICADKTGTITENRMTVAAWHMADKDYSSSLEGVGPDAGLERALEAAVLCNDADLDPATGEVRGSSTEGALLLAARAAAIDHRALRARFPVIDTRPRLDGDHWMGTTHTAGTGRIVFVKGAPEHVLAQSTRRLDGHRVVALDPPTVASLAARAARVAAGGLRVLALAYKDTGADDPVSYDDLVWIGLVAFTDPVRPSAREAVAACRRAGIRTVILTGDHPETAAAVGRDLGLARTADVRVVEASELTGLDEEALRQLVRDADVFARVTPADKYRIVRALQAGGDVVAMTGDGINDAAALRAADIGVAMGARGTDVARDLADVVLLDDDFSGFVHAVAQGRTIHGNIGKSLRFLLATNFSEILVTVVSLAVGRASPLSPVQFLWINLLSDVLPALALAVEPPEPDVMAQPPRDPAAPLLTARTFGAIAGEAAVIAAATLGAHVIGGSSPAGRASSMAFSTLTASQLMHALTLRTRGHSPRLLAGVVGGSVALHTLAMTAPPLRRLLGTSPLSVGDWGIVAAASTVPLLVNGYRAATVARAHHPRPAHGGHHGREEVSQTSAQR